MVRYIGHVDGKSHSLYEHFIGIEIRITDGMLGDTDGTFRNKRYFKCPTNSGIFIEPKKIAKRFSPEVELIITKCPSDARTTTTLK